MKEGNTPGLSDPPAAIGPVINVRRAAFGDDLGRSETKAPYAMSLVATLLTASNRRKLPPTVKVCPGRISTAVSNWTPPAPHNTTILLGCCPRPEAVNDGNPGTLSIS